MPSMLQSLNPAKWSPDPNDMQPPMFQEGMEDMYVDDMGAAQEDEDVVSKDMPGTPPWSRRWRWMARAHCCWEH